MRIFDASSIVYGWDNYPIETFPKLWDWLASEIAFEEILMSRVCFEEVEHVSPECAAWLSDKGVALQPVSNAIATTAMAIKAVLGIQNDDFHPGGVDENDVIAIATAKDFGVELVSDEGWQPTLPSNMKKYKIPAVCGLPSVGVTTLNFLAVVKGANRAFG